MKLKLIGFVLSVFTAHAGFAQQSLVKQEHSTPIISIITKASVVPPTAAQAKDYLLWYKGKNIDDTTLITTNGTLVRWSKGRDKVIIQAKKDPFTKLLKELEKTELIKEQFYYKVSQYKTGVMNFPMIEATLRQLDNIKDEYTSILKNNIDLPPVITESNAGIKWRGSTINFAMLSHHFLFSAGIPEAVKKAYNDVLAAKKNYPSIDFPAPPARELGSCIDCDTAASAKQNNAETEWQKEIIKYEAGIINKSMSIAKTLSGLNLMSDPEAVQMITGLNQAMDFAQARINNKIDLLIRKYGNDFTRLSAVIHAAISAERQKQLLGTAGEESYGKTMLRLIKLFDGFEKYLQQQMDNRNYDVVLNMPFIIGLERQRQLLGADDNRSGDYIDKLNAFNRFKIETEIEYIDSWQGCGRMQEKFTASNKSDAYLSLGYSNCKFVLGPAEEAIDAAIINKKNLYALEIHTGSTMNTITSDDEDCKTETINLKGLEIKSSPPSASFNFCSNGEKDTLTFHSMHISSSGDNRVDKRYSHLQFPNFYKAVNTASSFPPDSVFLELEELEKKSKPLEGLLNPTFEQMKAQYFIRFRLGQLRKALKEYSATHTDRPTAFLDAKNGDEVIVDETIIKSYSGENGESATNGEATYKIKVKITHDPLPYKTSSGKK